MTRPVAIKGFRLKDGKLVRVSAARSVSDKIKERKSKQVRAARRATLYAVGSDD